MHIEAQHHYYGLRKTNGKTYFSITNLISIIQNLGSKPLHSELGTKLEDMVFGQLRSADPEQTARFVNLEVNVKLFSQLMGTLSNTR